jgi:transcriptional regulator with XRE-family HTH domain
MPSAQDDTDRSAEEFRLAARLKEAREYVGVSQEAVAHELGIPRASVSAMEAAARRVTGLELRRLARLYRTTVNALLGEEGQLDPVESALFRAARDLSEQDQRQVLRFAEFLRTAGTPDGERTSNAAQSD